jgi:hypothetical protein
MIEYAVYVGDDNQGTRHNPGTVSGVLDLVNSNPDKFVRINGKNASVAFRIVLKPTSNGYRQVESFNSLGFLFRVLNDRSVNKGYVQFGEGNQFEFHPKKIQRTLK